MWLEKRWPWIKITRYQSKIWLTIIKIEARLIQILSITLVGCRDYRGPEMRQYAEHHM